MALLTLALGSALPRHSSAATAQPRLTVDLSHPLRYLSPQLFGSNVDWNAEFDFLEPGTTSFYPTFLGQVSSIGFGALRFPGGTLGSYYHWKRAIGPLADRRVNTFFGSGGPEPSLFGPDEYGQLLATSKAVGDVIVNPDTGTVAEARDFVAYMTLPAPRYPVTNPADPRYWAWLRARNGHPAPYPVPWWEVGNEVNTAPANNTGWITGSPVSYTNTHCANPNPLACLYVFGGITGFQHQPVGEDADTSAGAALSDGTAGQVKFVTAPPVVPGSAHVYVADQQWTQVSDLADAGPADQVYQLDASTGQISFGDGTHGAIPAAGAQITASYHSGPHAGFVDFYRAMKAVNPSIRVCLGASSVFPDIGAYLQDLGSTHPYDCVPWHPYVRNGSDLAAGYLPNSLPEDQYDTELLAMPQALANQVRHVRQQIDEYAGGNARRITTPITEFGQLRSSNPAFDRQFHLSLQEGILIALELRQWVELGVPMTEHYLLEGSPFGTTAPHGNRNVNSEIVGPGPNTFLESTAYVEQLFRALGGEQEVGVGATAVPTVTLPDGSSLPVLETLAGHRGGRVSLIVVNQSPNTPVTATVAGGLSGALTATMTTLDADSALSYNSPSDPTAVTLSSTPLPVTAGSATVTLPAHSIDLIEFSANEG